MSDKVKLQDVNGDFAEVEFDVSADVLAKVRDSLLDASKVERTQWPVLVFGSGIAVRHDDCKPDDKGLIGTVDLNVRKVECETWQKAYCAKHAPGATSESLAYKIMWKQGRDHFNSHVDRTLRLYKFKAQAAGGKKASTDAAQPSATDAAKKAAEALAALGKFDADFSAAVNECQRTAEVTGEALTAFEGKAKLKGEAARLFAAVLSAQLNAIDAARNVVAKWVARAVPEAAADAVQAALNAALKDAKPADSKIGANGGVAQS